MYMKITLLSVLYFLIDVFIYILYFIHIGDVTIVGKGLQILGLCSMLIVFKHRGIFFVLHL